MDPVSFNDNDNDDNSKQTRWNGGFLLFFRYHQNKRYAAMLLALAVVGVTVTIITTTSVSSDSTSWSWPRSIERRKQLQQQRIRLMIPQCESSPWRENEDLMGTCPGDILKPVTASSSETTAVGMVKIKINTAIECADDCCHKPDCIAWQFRRDKGCLQGTQDIRIGQEKDGPATYCSDHPPFKWNGQYIKDRTKDCSVKTWQPDSQPGQCFGLGDVRDPQNIKTAQQCMERCCAEEDTKKCGAWQFQPELGCFYGGSMQSCQPSDDPIVFEPFVGRRKIQSGRTYTDKDGKPAHSYSEKFMTGATTTTTTTST